MIDFAQRYYIQESDIVAIERGYDPNRGAYPFTLSVHTRNGLNYDLGYKLQDARDKAAADMVRKVECATRDRDMEQIYNKLWLMQSDLSKLDKRQLKIWRQLKELLGLKDKEDTP